MKELKGRINLGDGNGGIVSQLKNQNEMKLSDESWLNYQRAKGGKLLGVYGGTDGYTGASVAVFTVFLQSGGEKC